MIAGGCLSPLLAALMLTPLDQAMGAAGRSGGIGYIRDMDDFIGWTRQDKAFVQTSHQSHPPFSVGAKLRLH